jgi:hypothetical protein
VDLSIIRYPVTAIAPFGELAYDLAFVAVCYIPHHI